MSTTLNLKKAVTKYNDRPDRVSPSPNFMRMTQSYLNNINDSREDNPSTGGNMNSSLGGTQVFNMSMLSSLREPSAHATRKEYGGHKYRQVRETSGSFANGMKSKN